MAPKKNGTGPNAQNSVVICQQSSHLPIVMNSSKLLQQLMAVEGMLVQVLQCLHFPFIVYLRRRGQLKCDGTRAETSFRLSTKRTSPFKSAGASVQSITGSRGVRIIW